MRNLHSFNSNLTIRQKFLVVIWRFLETLLHPIRIFSLPNKLLLRLFGSKIGRNVLIRRNVRVHFPWNLEIGDDCWIGEDVWLINHEMVKIGSNVCISQRAIVCSGGHDYRSASLKYSHKPIEIRDGAWICLDAKVLPGVTIGKCSVVAAGEIVRKSIPDNSMLIAGEIRQINSPK